METKGIVIAGLSGGAGKSVVAVGLTASLVAKGHRVIPFKKGPDYIDAGWMARAAKKGCYNLDPYLMDTETICASFKEHSFGYEFAVVEGNRGLYDGVNAQGGYSTAELALVLDLPVILVVNCSKTTRTVAAMVLGCQMLDKRVDIRGVILNNVATRRQETIITEAVEKATGIPVIGVVPRLKADIFPMRHLGMVPCQEYVDSEKAIAYLADVFKDSIDLEKVKGCMASVSTAARKDRRSLKKENGRELVKIGIIQDTAFQFYYAGNLEALENEGARLIPINALTDTELPSLDGMYIGGGFPETNAGALAANHRFREAMRREVLDGLPVYAECGGLIYLGDSLQIDGNEYKMVGIFPVHFTMSEKPQAHGYSIFEVEQENPFYPVGTEVKGHEFRYSVVEKWRGDDACLTVRMKRGKGFIAGRDGLVYKNVFALYTHVHAYGTPQWAPGLVARCRSRRSILKEENKR